MLLCVLNPIYIQVNSSQKWACMPFLLQMAKHLKWELWNNYMKLPLGFGSECYLYSLAAKLASLFVLTVIILVVSKTIAYNNRLSHLFTNQF